MSTDHAHRQWLLEQMPQLEAQGVLDAASAARLRTHLRETAPAVDARTSWAVIVFGVIGAGLIGLSIVLLFAHNWESWTRATRTAASLAPLALSLLLAGYVLARRPASRAWREAAATFNALACAGAIALIGQTYHIHGDLPAFLLSCALLALPLAYLLDSVVVTVLYLAVIASWSWQADNAAPQYVLWLALALPQVWRSLRQDRHGLRGMLLLWAVVLSLVLSLAQVWPQSQDHSWPLAYAALFAALLLADGRWFADQPALWRRPLRVVGLAGTAVLALIFVGEDGNQALGGIAALRDSPLAATALPLALLGAALTLWVLALRARDVVGAVFGALPLLVLVAEVAGLEGGTRVLLFNLYALALAALPIREGLATRRLRSLNFGLAILAVVITLRFVDSDLPYTLRALGFMVVGCAFLGLNLYLVRGRRA